jgi:hypothetical protein
MVAKNGLKCFSRRNANGSYYVTCNKDIKGQDESALTKPPLKKRKKKGNTERDYKRIVPQAMKDQHDKIFGQGGPMYVSPENLPQKAAKPNWNLPAPIMQGQRVRKANSRYN